MDFLDSEEGKVSKDLVYVQETASFIMDLINQRALVILHMYEFLWMVEDPF